MYRTKLLLLLSVCSSLYACVHKAPLLPYYDTPDFTAVFTNEAAGTPGKTIHHIAAFSFTDQDGNTITRQSVEGHIHVASFLFTSCNSICPVMTSHLKKVSTRFRNDTNVVLLSYSVMPWADSVSQLKSYVQKNKITNPRWHFLTGQQSAIYHLARTSYFAEEAIGYSKDSTEFLHTEHVLLVDPHQRIRGIYNGTLETDIDQLEKDILLLEKETMEE